MDWKERAKAKVDRVEQIRQREEELDRKALQAAQANYATAVGLVQGNVTAGRDEYIQGMSQVQVKVAPRENLTDPSGPWVGVKIGDREGAIATIDIQAVVTAASVTWAWHVQCGTRRNPPKRDVVRSSAQGP